MPRKVNKKVSPKRKKGKTSPGRRLNPPKTPKSLGRLAAREVLEQGFDERDIGPFMRRDIVDEINYGYSYLLDKYYNRQYVRDPRLVDEDEFGKTTREFKNYKRLLRTGVDDFTSHYASELLSDHQIDNMLMLRNEGFINQFAIETARRLTDSQIDTMLRIHYEGFNNMFATIGATEFTEHQIDAMIIIKNEGFGEFFAYTAAKEFSNRQIDAMIRIRNSGVGEFNAYVEAADFY